MPGKKRLRGPAEIVVLEDWHGALTGPTNTLTGPELA